MDIRLEPRVENLDPVSVIGLGSVAQALARRLLDLPDEHLGALRGTAGDAVVAVLGEAELLPWVDGVVYLGRDAQAPRLLLPTTHRPTLDLGLFERAVARRAEKFFAPWAVLFAPPILMSLAEARPIERDYVSRWLEGSL